MEALAFIEQIPPFDQLQPDDLALVRQALQRVEGEAGAHAAHKTAPPSTYLNIVRSGSVELRTNGQIRITCWKWATCSAFRRCSARKPRWPTP